MRYCLLLVALCVLMVSPAPAENSEKDISQSGDTVLSATLAKKRVIIRLHAVKLKRDDPGFPLALDQYNQASLIKQMSISVDGENVWVPRSVYADLFNARRGSLTSENGVFVLLIGGADGADSYSVHIRFNSTQVMSRAVYNTMTPQRLSEKTVYSKTEVIG